MTRRLTVLFSFFEAVLVAGIGVAIPLVPLTIVWAVQYGFGPDWLVFGRTALDIWLVGHGVDLTVVVNPMVAAAIGQPPGPLRFTIAALGFALLTGLLGVRAGGRIAETGHRVLGCSTAVVTFAVLAAAATWGGRLAPDILPSRGQGVLLPTAVFLGGLLTAMVTAEPDEHPTPMLRALRKRIRDAPVALRAILGSAVRAGLAAASILVLAAAVALAALIVGSYAELIRMYESLHGEWAGGLALTAGQLAILPNLVVWTASWFVGPGFALGTGSAISPLGSVAGPLPAIPVLGAIPQGELAFGFAGLAVPVVAGFLAGVATRASLRRALDGPAGWRAVPVAVGGGAVGGTVMGLLAWASAGSAGPGRFAQVGPDPLAVGLVAALEFALSVGIGLAVGGAGRVALERTRAMRPSRTERPARTDRPSRTGRHPRHPAPTVPAPPRIDHDSVDTAPIDIPPIGIPPRETVPPRRDD